METTDITTLIERCTAPALVKPVAAIMRQASEFEPEVVPPGETVWRLG